jgi:hypothetical protein
LSLILDETKLKPKTSWFKDYDSEFKSGDENNPHLADEVRAYAEGDRHETTSSQTKETLIDLNERNEAQSRKFQMDKQEELKFHRTGKIYHMNEFMRRLRSTGMYAWYTTKGGMAGTLGLFVQHTGRKPACMNKHANGEPHYVGFVQVPFMQEFDEIRVDDHNLPIGFKRRGWRSLLLCLIGEKILTEAQAHEAFFAPIGSVISRRYLETLYKIRNS